MTRSPSRRHWAGLPDATDIHAELTRIKAMNIEELREMWRAKRRHEPPAALTKDLMARALAHWLQEERLGGLEAPLRRLLATVAKKGSMHTRRLKIGSVIVREYQGKAQEVLVVPGGFCWEGRIYPSLSTIALKITGTNWNGPRFFGLRGAEEFLSGYQHREDNPITRPADKVFNSAQQEYARADPSHTTLRRRLASRRLSHF